jgi:Ca2+-transporting ATPase
MITNSRLWTALGAVVALQVAVVHWPPLHGLFGTVPLRLADWALCAGTASTVLLAEEVRKLILRLIKKPTKPTRSTTIPMMGSKPA